MSDTKKQARKEIEQLAARIEGLALKLSLEEMCAVMTACGTIRCAALGYAMRMVKTSELSEER